MAALRDRNSEKIMDELEKNINDSLDLNWEWKKEISKRSQQVQPGDVVKIKTKRCQNQWAIVARENNQEYTCNLLVFKGELRDVQKAELRVLNLSIKQEQEAFELMLRLQAAWRLLWQLPEERCARVVIKAIAEKDLPLLTELDAALLKAIEETGMKVLTEKIRARKLD